MTNGYAQGGTPPPPMVGNQPPQGNSALAITGLVIGLVALLLAFVPIINNFAFVLALVGVGFGIGGIIVTRGVHARRKGKGMAWAGSLLSVLALVGVLVSQAIYSEMLDSLSEELDAQTASPLRDEKQQGSAGSESDHEERQSPDDRAGETSAPRTSLSWGETARFPDGVEVRLSAPTPRSLSSTDVLGLSNQDLRTAAEFEVEIHNKSEDSVDTALAQVRAQYGKSEVVEAEDLFLPEYDTLFDGPKLQPGKSTTLTVAFQVPEKRFDQLTVEVGINMGLDHDPVFFSASGKN